MSTLLDLSEHHLTLTFRLESLLTETEGEITDDVQALFDEQIALEYEEAQKFDGYGYAMSQFEAEEQILDARIKALQARKDTRKNARTRMKDRLKFFLETHGLTKIEGEYFTFRIQKNGGKDPVELSPDIRPEDLPQAFQRVRVDIDTAAIYEALKAGQELEFARLGEKGTHLRII